MSSISRSPESAPVSSVAALRTKKRRELSDEQRQEMRDAFALFDEDKDGFVDYHELKVGWPLPCIIKLTLHYIS